MNEEVTAIAETAPTEDPVSMLHLTPRQLWTGQFGDAYTKRNKVDWKSRVPFWQRISDTIHCDQFLDVGTNMGWNLRALRHISDKFQMSGVDINHLAVMEAQEHFDVIEASARELVDNFGPKSSQCTITSGVLIHIPPSELQAVMRSIIEVTSDYIVCIEYEAPQEEMVPYRGHFDKLWKRPYGRLYEEMGCSIVEYGESAEGFDSCAWWILERP